MCINPLSEWGYWQLRSSLHLFALVSLIWPHWPPPQIKVWLHALKQIYAGCQELVLSVLWKQLLCHSLGSLSHSFPQYHVVLWPLRGPSCWWNQQLESWWSLSLENQANYMYCCTASQIHSDAVDGISTLTLLFDFLHTILCVIKFS